jgi:hypothetical protein
LESVRNSLGGAEPTSPQTASVVDRDADQALGVRFIILNVETSSCTESFQNLCKLPSTSPANASWSFERKLAAWREVMALAGLVSG